MTKEELEKEVKDYLRQQKQLNGGGLVSLNIKNLVLGFAETLNNQLTEKDKQIEELKKEHWYEMYELECLKTKELEAQIEKMKCCNNCKYKDLNYSFRPICTVKGYDNVRDIENPVTCKCDKWELFANIIIGN